MAPVEPPSAATVLAGRYRLERRVAQGGMAEVWLASDLSLNRQVAVKLLKPHLASDAVIAERFRREAIAVASVSHTNIVQVFDAVADGDRQAVVMQFVDGKSLRRLLDEQKQLGPELTVHIGMALAGALDAAHSAGLVHRDVKPGNVMVTPDGKVLLTDFGIAKALGGGDDLTSDNVMMGTAKYLSPEQVRGRRLDGRADLYALGLVLYECLAGKVPFQGETDADTALARLQRDPTDLTQLRPTVPGGLVDVINKLVQREPDDRFATGAEVRTALSRALATPEPAVDVPPTPTGGATPVATAPPSTKVVRSTERSDRTPSSSHFPRNPRDRTPHAPRRRPPPAKLQQQWKPSLVVVGGLLVLALVMVIVLWAAARTQDDDGSPIASDGDVTIERFTLYDPQGDGTEAARNELRYSDGQLDTPWRTLCYSDAEFGKKETVGLIADLSGTATSGALVVTFADSSWTADVYRADGTPPAAAGGLAAWGAPVDSGSGSAVGSTWTVELDAPANHLLVALRKVGRSTSCESSSNVYRGQINQLRFSSGG